MIIDLKEIPEEGAQLQGVLNTGPYDFPKEDMRGWDRLEYDFFVVYADGEAVVQGKIKTNFKTTCARCLGELPQSIEVENFCHSYQAHSEASIDLTEDIREDTLLSLPIAAKCELDDKNRCPYTGIEYGDKREEASETQQKENIWGALDELTDNEK